MSLRLFLLLFFSAAWGCATSPSSGAGPSGFGDEYVDVSHYSGVTYEIRYATTNNFVGENLYGTYNKPYLHRVAAAKLKHAAEELQTLQPGWKLLIFDGLRPRTVQRKLWARVVGTENAQYVADPDKGSVHNYGFAVDLSLQNSRGEEVDMGTPFDSFQATAQPDLEEKLLQEGKLKQEQIDHRKILRKVMVDAGFTQLSNEWWHYDALPLQEIKKHYKIVE